MNFFVLLTTLIVVSNVNSQGINVKNLLAEALNLLSENADEIGKSVCDPGLKLNITGDDWNCVLAEAIVLPDAGSPERPDAASPEETTTELPVNIANDCPSTGCPVDPGCHEGFELLVIGENCCCIKKDEPQPLPPTEAPEPDSAEEPEPVTEAPEDSSSVSSSDQEQPAADSQAPEADSSDEPAAPAEEPEEEAGTIADDCPAVGCPENAACHPGFQLLVHDANCCCIKADEPLE